MIRWIAALCVCFATVVVADDRPNVVVILADDLGYADLSCQGSKQAKTPNIDTIATNGIRFTDGYVSCPVCSPSRAGLLTGRYQQRFGLEFNPRPEAEHFGLPVDQVTIADVMKKAGYATGMIGKWHEGNEPQFHPNRRGFDEYYGFLGGHHPYIDFKNIVRNETPVDDSGYLTDAFGREAVAFVDRHKSQPFFLYLAFNAVHTPLQATQKYLDRVPDIRAPKRQKMLAMLSAMDDAVGELLKKLDDEKLTEKTLVIFLSDNGGETPSNASRNEPLSGIKGELLEGGIREPFMVQWKSHIKPGQVSSVPIISLDIFPTVAAVAGAAVPENIDGKNLKPLLTGESNAQVHDALYWRYGTQSAIRVGDWKLENFKLTGRRLYNLKDDLAENHDLSAADPDRVQQMQAMYDQWNSQNRPPKWAGKEKEDAGEH